MDQKEFGLYFVKIREASGFKSQRQLAIASGVSNGTIARIEDGSQKVKPETLRILSKYLKGVDYEDLMAAAGYLDSEQEPNLKGNFAYYGGGDDWTDEDKAEAQVEVRKALAQRARAKLFEALGKETVDKLMQLPEVDQEMALQQLKQTVEFLNKKNKQED